MLENECKHFCSILQRLKLTWFAFILNLFKQIFFFFSLQRQSSSPGNFCYPATPRLNMHFCNVVGLQLGDNNTMHICATDPLERKRHPTAPSAVNVPPPHLGGWGNKAGGVGWVYCLIFPLFFFSFSNLRSYLSWFFFACLFFLICCSWFLYLDRFPKKLFVFYYFLYLFCLFCLKCWNQWKKTSHLSFALSAVELWAKSGHMVDAFSPTVVNKYPKTQCQEIILSRKLP